MGKGLSKHGSHKRENPEGDSFVVNSYISRKGLEGCERFMGLENKLKYRHEELQVGALKDELDDRFPLEERDAVRNEHSEEMKAANKCLSAHERRNISEQQSSNETGNHYCVDENTERRNHYLDLAGIENYTSRFGPAGSPDQHTKEEQYKSPHSRPVHHRRSQVFYDYSAPHVESMHRLSEMHQRSRNQEKLFMKSPKVCGKPSAMPNGMSGGKSGKGINYSMPVHPSQAVQSGQDIFHLQQQQYKHKRYRQKSKDIHSPLKTTHPQAAAEHEFIRDFPSVLTNEGYVIPVIQRHEHRHHHEHHHHHHYHHYQQ